MNEDFVPCELAVKLKEKGFREECLCHYIGDNLFYNIESPIANKQLWFSHNKFDNIWHRDNYDAPTISQALKWLREEKLILIALSPTQEYDCNGFIGWCATVYKADKQGGMSWQEEFYYQSYELAALVGIEYVLNNLI